MTGIYEVKIDISEFKPKRGEYKHPKILHFIWHSKVMPEDHLQNILSAARRAQLTGYTIKLWTDHDKHIYQAFARHADLEGISNLEIADFRDIEEIIDEHFSPEHALKLKTLYAHETSGVAVNAAAVSDIQRLLILLHDGGLYCDIDNLFLPTKVKSRMVGSSVGLELAFIAGSWAQKHGDPYASPPTFTDILPEIMAIGNGSMLFESKLKSHFKSYSALYALGEASDKVRLPDVTSPYGFMRSSDHGNSLLSSVAGSQIVKFILLEMCNAYEAKRVASSSTISKFFTSTALDRKRCPKENDAASRTEFYNAVLYTSGPEALHDALYKLIGEMPGATNTDVQLFNYKDDEDRTLPLVGSSCDWLRYVTPSQGSTSAEQCNLFGHEPERRYVGLAKRDAEIATPRASVTTFNAEQPGREPRIKPMFTATELAQIELRAEHLQVTNRALSLIP